MFPGPQATPQAHRSPPLMLLPVRIDENLLRKGAGGRGEGRRIKGASDGALAVCQLLCPVGSMCSNSLQAHSNPVRQTCQYDHHLQGGNGGTERVSNLPSVAQLVSDRARNLAPEPTPATMLSRQRERMETNDEFPDPCPPRGPSPARGK